MFVQAGSRARFDNGAPPVREGECAATQKVQEAAASPAPWTPPLLVQVKTPGAAFYIQIVHLTTWWNWLKKGIFEQQLRLRPTLLHYVVSLV